MTAIGFWRDARCRHLRECAVPPATPNNGVRCCAARSAPSNTKEQLEHMIEVMTGIGRQLGVLGSARSAWWRRPLGRIHHVHPRHLSDPHLPMPQARVLDLLGKRATGYYNWWRNRVPCIAPRRWPASWPTSRPAIPDHIAPDRRSRERLAARRVRARLAMARHARRPDRVTIVPGNHDVYVATLWREGLGRGGLYGGRRPAAGHRFHRLSHRAPTRPRGAVVGLNSGVPKPPFSRRAPWAKRRFPPPESAGGTGPRRALPRRDDPSSAAHHRIALQEPDRRRRLPGDDPPGRLRDRAARPQSSQRSRAHRGPAGDIPVVGVTSASAAPGSKYGRARYHLIGIERGVGGWRITLDIRALAADGTGCEPDGRIVFKRRARPRWQPEAAMASSDITSRPSSPRPT